MWDGGLRALRVLKYVVSNPKDEVTRLEYTTRKTAGRIPLSSTHMEVAILKYMFVLFLGKYLPGVGGFKTAITSASEPI